MTPSALRKVWVSNSCAALGALGFVFFFGVGFGSILLKNSFPTGDEKILALIGSDARFRLGGHTREWMLR
jgi:hypothetical protein